MSSGAKPDTPVMLPPGRARSWTSSVLAASPSVSMTIGIVLVARLTARIAGAATAKITSGFKVTNSVARLGSRS